MVDFNHKGNGKPKEPGGKGDSTHLVNATQENKIIATMLNPRKRWKVTRAIKAKALAAIERNLESADDRVVNGATRNLLVMEAQNMQDQHKATEKPESVTNQQINIYLPSNDREQVNGYDDKNGRH